MRPAEVDRGWPNVAHANYCVGASGEAASVLIVVGNQPLHTDPMPLADTLNNF